MNAWLVDRFVYSDGANNDAFGTAVSTCQIGYSLRAAVGAPQAQGGAVPGGAGLVRVYHASSILVTIENPEAGDGFGQSVAVSPETVAVGSPIANGTAAASGAVFAYADGSWSMQKLSGADSAMDDAFGWSTAIAGDTLVVGSPYADGGSVDAGAAYVFVRAGGVWSQQAKLLASDRAAGDRFGWEVAISGDTVMVGASRDDGAATDTGAAYVFVRTGTSWSQQAKLTASDAQAGDLFGNAVSIDGDMAAIGANADDDRGNAAGAAYVFSRSGAAWRQVVKLVADDGAPGDYFGATVGIRGGDVAVGAPFNDTWEVDTGSVYVFANGGGGWIQQGMMVPGDAIEYDNFGSALSFKGGLLVGSPFAVDWDDYTYPGAAYFIGVSSAFADVHRFYNAVAGTHFYTIDEAEKRSVQQNLSHIFTYEGIAYSFTASRNTKPLHRFYNVRTGTHFYTADEAELNRVRSTLAGVYVYEGVAYNVAAWPVAPAIDVHRFYNVRTGTHFYTASAEEKAQVQATLGHIYQYDGLAYSLQL